MTFEIHRGTNISHWLSQSGDRGEARQKRFTREDCTRLADVGMDHLRLPVDEEQLWDADGNQEQEAWDLLNAGLDWCREEGMRAAVDLHILRSHYFNAGPNGTTLFTDPAAARQFADVWRELSCELRNRSIDWVAYELLNEAVADDHEDWNRVLRAPYDAIRESEPERKIAIGSNRWCQATTFDALKVPEGDPNIILVFHYYNPMPITHYRASWTKDLCHYTGPIQYPGRPIPPEALHDVPAELRDRLKGMNEPFGPDVMAETISIPLKVAERLGLPLWCNEFGVVAGAPEPIRRAWLRDFRGTLESNGIAWSNWDFRGSFGLYDRDGTPTPVLDALFGGV